MSALTKNRTVGLICVFLAAIIIGSISFHFISSSQPSKDGKKEWKVLQRQDGIRDTNSVILHRDAEGDEPIGLESEIMVACAGGERPSVIFHFWPPLQQQSSRADVTYRLGKNDPKQDEWRVDSDNETLRPDSEGTLVREILSSPSLWLEVNINAQETKQMHFEMDGIQPLYAQYCSGSPTN
jgi:hypothetical protein